jgi:putative copper resistance protein D
MTAPLPGLFAAIRALHLAGLMLLFGSAVLLLRLRRGAPELAIESGGLRRARLASSIIAVVTVPLWLGLATAQMAGDAGTMIDPQTLWLTLQDTLFGQMLALRFGLVLLLAGAVAIRTELSTALLSGAALILIAVTSHAAAASPAGFTAIGIVDDALHLLCGGYWIGGLGVLAAIMALRPEAPRLLKALSLFADWAMIAVALLVLTGMINAATIILGGEGHAAQTYLTVLGVKLVLVLAMIALALGNHFRLMPRLAKPQTRMILRGNITWELGLGLLVIALAALLGLLPPTL